MANARGAKLIGLANPLPLSVTIGNDIGTTSVRAHFECGDDHDPHHRSMGDCR
jgi:hypothetical protein